MTLKPLHKRILSGLVLAPLTVAVIFAGGWPFCILLSLSYLLCIREWFGLVRAREYAPALLLAGAGYLAVSHFSYIFIRFAFEQGALLALSIMVCVWLSDISAYVAGRRIGGPKLVPSISPNKTWAGFAGAVAGCGLAMMTLFLLKHLLAPLINTSVAVAAGNFWAVFLAGCVLGAVSQAGDLLISIFKRRAGVKDSGHLIPGHGGLLDRIDSLLLATPCFLLILMVFLP